MNAFEKELEDVMANDQELRKPPLFVASSNKPASPPTFGVATDVKAFMEKSAGMYERQRKILLDLEAGYDASRAKIVDDYRRRMDDLQHEAVEAVRSLDATQHKTIGEAKQILQALGRMRGED